MIGASAHDVAGRGGVIPLSPLGALGAGPRVASNRHTLSTQNESPGPSYCIRPQSSSRLSTLSASPCSAPAAWA